MARKKKSMSVQGRLIGIFALIAAIIFLPTSLLLFVGMLPTLVALLTDRTRSKAKAITVGALNLAGCTYFLLDLWVGGQNFQKASEIVSDPHAIVVMYSTAGIGYIVDWSMSQIVANLLYQRGISRQDSISKRQAELIARWGEEVTGKIQLDDSGFPLEAINKN